VKNFYPVQVDKTLTPKDANISYTLMAFIVHLGGEEANEGHYICYFKDNQKWFLANDDSPFQVVDIDKVLKKKDVCAGIHTTIYQQVV
jgi:uncharacterized UBP type Zn finger protein